MLENSLWIRYLPDVTIREVLARLYGCDARDISDNEGLLYASLKRHLTKKEFRLVMMHEAHIPSATICDEVGIDPEKFEITRHRAYRKIAQEKIRTEVRCTYHEEDPSCELES